MDLITLAVPAFLALIAVELVVDKIRGTGYMPLSDAIGSMSAGAMSTTTGLFSKLIQFAIYALMLEHFALFDIPLSAFDASPSGLAAWLGALLLWDFLYYWKHRLGHEVSLFWAAHSVHHQSEEYNLTTALRQTSSDFLVGWVVYLPFFLLGIPLYVFITVSAIDLIYQFWVHTRHIDKLGWADRVFVTPSNHRVHHAQNAQYIDKNYGGILIIWDRLFGTYAAEDDNDPVVFGVRKPLASFDPLSANLQVYRYLWFDARRTASWRDKLAIWFRRTGWRPGDVRQRYPTPARDPASFKKFQPAQPLPGRIYLLLQFVVAMLVTMLIGQVAASLDWLTLAGGCLWLWLLLIGIGHINDRHVSGLRFEMIRLAVAFVMPLVWALSAAPERLPALAAALGLYVATSALLLWWLRRASAPKTAITAGADQAAPTPG